MPKKRVKTNGEMIRGKNRCNPSGCGASFYGVGFIGALVYYLSTASGFWAGVLGILKSIVWPAFLVFNLLKFIGA